MDDMTISPGAKAEIQRRIQAVAADVEAAHLEYEQVTAENARLREEIAALRAAVEDVDATLTREDDGEWVRAYVMPAGPWHRLLGLVRGAGT